MWLAVVGAVVAVGIAAFVWGPGLYASWAAGKADAAPTLDVDASAPVADPGTLDGLWVAQDGSYAGYRVDEVLTDETVTVTGRTEQVQAEVTLDAGTLSAATVTVDMASIETDEPQRDAFFRDTALSTDEFPTATFELTEPATLSAGATRVELTGDLTVHGVTRPVSVMADLAQADDGEVQVVGSVPITFEDFGVSSPSLGFVSVEDSGAIEFSLLLARAG
ncbi:YceI family protein [Xylanimonas allomyrinae]|uniref:YceI family protein n=1 Tax=Xylanimonas allomyrinae TaxID=2509459 RepID=UPI001FE628BE|nr:YceI family protein [Xylanimonas allomyrinae]